MFCNVYRTILQNLYHDTCENDEYMPKAIEYLEYLQNQMYSKLGYTQDELIEKNKGTHDEIINELVSSYKGFVSSDAIEQIKTIVKRQSDDILAIAIPTKYENRIEYSLILEISRDIEEAIPALKLTHDDTKKISTLQELSMNIVTPSFGTLPSGDVNAQTIPCDDGYLIVFESELFYFCHLISKIIAHSFPFEKNGNNVILVLKEDEILNRLESNKEILKHFGELIIGCLIGGRPRAAPRYSLEMPYSDIASVLTQAMERFVMGHEYSHILLRHNPIKNGQINLTDIKNVYNKMFSWPQEYEADYLGLQLMFKAMEKVENANIAFDYCAVEIFFLSFEIMKRAISIMKRGNDDFYWKEGVEDGPVGTHPPFEYRRGLTRSLMSKKYGEDSVKLSKLVELIIVNLWANTKPYVESMREQGFTLHPKWLL